VPEQTTEAMKGKSPTRPTDLCERLLLLAVASALVIISSLFWAVSASQQPSGEENSAKRDGLSATEFSNLVRDLSEEGGYFRSDNFTSNESAYLTVVDKLKQLGATGGAYVGVGPEQNFSYIAKLRPRIAFIVDIRRQAIIQHLMYKAIFQRSQDRVQFLSLLLSRPLGKSAPRPNAPIDEIISALEKVPADDRAYASNLAALQRTIQEEFRFPLTELDLGSLGYVYRSFRVEGLDIAFHIEGSLGGYFPTLRDLVLQKDQHGNLGNFLATSDDYEFVRNMQRKNLIIPVVGNFGGKKALASVGDYLRRNGFTLSAFYTSNVEQYLFEDRLFGNFVENVRKLPVTDQSYLIRSVSARYYHPAQLAGYRSTTLLQQINVFLRDFDSGKFQTYGNLIQTDYIGPEK
jgi:hypothetical protein